jgi:hypothetical protein
MKKSQKLPLHCTKSLQQPVPQFLAAKQNVVSQCFVIVCCLLVLQGGWWVGWERLWNNVKFHLVPHLEECLAGDAVNPKFLFLGT